MIVATQINSKLLLCARFARRILSEEQEVIEISEKTGVRMEGANLKH